MFKLCSLVLTMSVLALMINARPQLESAAAGGLASGQVGSMGTNGQVGSSQPIADAGQTTGGTGMMAGIGVSSAGVRAAPGVMNGAAVGSGATGTSAVAGGTALNGQSGL